VHRAFEQQQQGRSAYIAATTARASAHRRVGAISEGSSPSAASTASYAACAERASAAVVVCVVVIVFVGSWIHVAVSFIVDAVTIYRYCIVGNLA